MIADRNRALDGAVVLAAGAALVCGFLPWTVDAGYRTTDAWHGSAVWPAVVGVAPVAALTWLLARRRALRTVASVVEVCAAAAALAYVAIEPVSSVEPAGYIGIGMIVALAILLAGDRLRGRSSIAQVLLGIGSGPLVTLSVLPWAIDPYDYGNGASLWNASAVWAVTVVVLLLAVCVVLIHDSRSTRLVAALPAAIAAGWALVFTVAQPYAGSRHPFAPTTVAIAKFTSGPHLVAGAFGMDVLEYAVVGCGVMAALALVLVVAAGSAVRTTTARDR